LERRGIPTVTIVSEPFEPLARSFCAAFGVDMKYIVIPHPVGARPPEELIEIARAQVARVAQAISSISVEASS
jgi:hypothetical protein